MALNFHYKKVQALSPKAAQIALRILDRDPVIPPEWIISLRPALVERSSEASDFKGSDWMTIMGIEHPRITKFIGFFEFFESSEQRHARLWARSLREAARSLHSN